MKKILFFIITLAFSTCLFGQEDLSESINQVKAPSSPASTILGITPGTINQPKTWDAFEAAIFSNYLSEDGLTVPNDFSIEFSPYNTRENFSITNDEFLGQEKSALRGLSFSISSTQSFVLSDTINSNAIGLGARTTIIALDRRFSSDNRKLYEALLSDLKLNIDVAVHLNGLNPFPETKSKLIDEVIAYLKQKETTFSNSKKDEKTKEMDFEYIRKIFESNLEYATEGKGDSLTQDEVNIERVDEILDNIGVDQVVKQIADNQSEFAGWKVELASALAIDFPNNETNSGEVPKWGFWITPSYTPYKTDWIQFLGVFRYYSYNTGFYEQFFSNIETFDNSVDYGLRLVFKKKKFSVELEGVGRSSSTKLSETEDNTGVKTIKKKSDSDFQWVFNFNYNINKDLSLSYNFGDQFNNVVLNNDGSLISLFSLNFSFGGTKKSDLEAYQD